ncbi:MAG: hypothetical protein O9328_05375 [Rhodobacteraceae bacterium]|nr:hypothetical protein [Paracoccaceae bacterium]
MTTKTTNAPISKSMVPVRQEQSEKSPAIKQTTTEKGHKLDKESQLAALFTTRKNAIITIKAAFQSIGSSKTMAEIKTELKAEVKTKFLDRFDKQEKENIQDKGVKNLKTPSLNSAERNKEFPFEMNKKAFQENTKLLLSVQIDTFITEAKMAGKRTDTEIGSFVSEKLDSIVKKNLSGDLTLSFQRDKFIEAKDEFKREGRSLKSDIVMSFITTMDEVMTKSGSIEGFEAKAKTNIGEQCDKVARTPKHAESFLRGQEDRPVSVVLFAHGMADVAKHVQAQFSEVMQTPGLSDMPPDLNLKGKALKPEHVASLKDAALKVLDALKTVEVSDDLTSKLTEFTQVIKDKVAKNELSAEQGKDLVHRFYVNAVVLRAVNPQLMNASKDNPAQGILNALAQFIQLVMNGGGGSKQFASKEGAHAVQQVVGGVENKFNQMLVDKFGMPDDVFQIKPELDPPPQVETNPQRDEPPSFEQYLAMQRQPPVNDPGNGQVNNPGIDPGKENKYPDEN